MESAFPKPTLVVALCLSTCSFLAHAAGLAAFHHNRNKANRVFQRRQTLYSAVAFCSILIALVIAESPEINASPKPPLAWYFVSVVFLEGDRRQLLAYNNPNTSEIGETILSLSPLLSLIRPLPLFYAVASKRYYSPLTFIPTIVEFLYSSYGKISTQHALHTYRCPMVAFLMFTFLVASLVTATLELDQSGLILGLTLDVLLLLTLPFRESWSEDTLVWWAKKCSGLLQKNIAGQTSRSGVGSESLEELQGAGSRESSAGSLSRDAYSVTEPTDPLSYPSVEERPIGMVK